MTYPTPKPGTGLNTIAFDLDGTLAEPTWPDPKIGKPILSAVSAVFEYARRGFEIIVYTSRPASHQKLIAQWLADTKLDNMPLLAVVYDIVTDKPRAAMYVDDRAVSFPFEEPKPCPRFHKDDAGPAAMALKLLPCASPLYASPVSAAAASVRSVTYYCVQPAGHYGKHQWQGEAKAWTDVERNVAATADASPSHATVTPAFPHVAAECSICRRSAAVGGFSTWGGKLE